jgi:hypothetical protein
MTQAKEDSSRFWELYILRYSVGAVLGALILFFLVKHNTPLSNLIFVKPGEPIDIIQVGIFLAVGLLYSYLASAPILVFHAGRFLIPKQASSFFSRNGIWSAFYLIFNLTLPIVFFIFSSLDAAIKYWFSIVIFLASAIFTGQIIIIFKCQKQRSEQFIFYKKLAINRSYAKGGIVESYRHLREHGNAFLIIIFEMILGVIMFAATMYSSFFNVGKPPEIYEIAANLVTVLIGWITPAAIVWLIACYIEQEFIES